MTQYLKFCPERWPNMFIPLGIFFLTLFLGLLLRKIIFLRLARLAKKTATPLDDIIIAAIREPFIIWSVILGFYFAIQLSLIPLELTHIINKLLIVLAIFSVTFALAAMMGNLISAYSRKLESTLPVTSLTRHIGRIIIFGIGVLIILNSLGISITPILATLGVGGLAVALALQDTLSNLFAGFHIIMTRQIRVGDYIKLESGEEGYVVDISWRTTKIRMLSNNIILVPNEKLGKAIVTNFYLPDREMAVLVNLGVHYASDLKKVEEVTSRVAKQVMKEVAGGVPQFDPFIRYHTFGDFSINFTVILRAKEFVDQYLVKHEFVKKLHEEYARENIVIPYPIRAINYEQEGASGLPGDKP